MSPRDETGQASPMSDDRLGEAPRDAATRGHLAFLLEAYARIRVARAGGRDVTAVPDHPVEDMMDRDTPPASVFGIEPYEPPPGGTGQRPERTRAERRSESPDARPTRPRRLGNSRP